MLQAVGELDQTVGLHGPDQTDLVDREAEFLGPRLINAQLGQRLHQIQISLTGGHNADFGFFPTHDSAIDFIGLGECLNRGQFYVVQPSFLHQLRIGPSHVNAIGW